MDKNKVILMIAKVVCILGIIGLSDIFYRSINGISHNVIRFGILIMLLKYMIVTISRVVDIKSFSVKKIALKSVIRRIIIMLVYDAICIVICATLLHFIKDDQLKFKICCIILLLTQIIFVLKDKIYLSKKQV